MKTSARPEARPRALLEAAHNSSLASLEYAPDPEYEIRQGEAEHIEDAEEIELKRLHDKLRARIEGQFPHVSMHSIVQHSGIWWIASIRASAVSVQGDAFQKAVGYFRKIARQEYPAEKRICSFHEPGVSSNNEHCYDIWFAVQLKEDMSEGAAELLSKVVWAQ